MLRNIAFSPEYAASVEQKQIAEQLAQQAAFVDQQREQEAEQARATARGQRDAAIIFAEDDAEAGVIRDTTTFFTLRDLTMHRDSNPVYLAIHLTLLICVCDHLF